VKIFNFCAIFVLTYPFNLLTGKYWQKPNSLHLELSFRGRFVIILLKMFSGVIGLSCSLYSKGEGRYDLY